MIGYRYYHRKVRAYLADPTKKPRTILGMTLFSLIFLGAFAIRPSLVVISQLLQELKEAREASQILEKKLSDLSQAQINLKIYDDKLQLVDQALPKEPEVPQIINALADSAGRHNVILQETVFSDTEEMADPRVKVIPFSVRASGSLLGIKDFIIELENGARQMDFAKVKISEGAPRDLRGETVAEIELKAFFAED
jgi:Tfp pilus assembly protein PilO